jgi:tetratricopeptide (TPR) repeat protein
MVFALALFVCTTLNAVRLEAATEDPARLNSEGATLFTGQHAEAALAKFNAALEACEPASETDACPTLASILSNLGSLYYSIGDYSTAEPILLRALGMSPPSEAEEAAAHSLAAAYWAQGRASESVPLYERALRLRQQRKDQSDISLLPLLTGLALAYSDSGEYARSREKTTAAIAIAQAHLKEPSRESAANFVVLGSILEMQGEFTQAQEWLDRGLELREKLFGPESLTVADAHVFLGALYRHQGRWSEAAQAYRSAIQPYQREHAAGKAASTLLALGRVLADQGRTKDAERVYRDGIAQLERLSGQRTPEVTVGLTGLANVMSARRRYAEAEELFRVALEIDCANFPPGDPRIAIDLSNFGALAVSRKHYSEAEEMLERSAAMLGQRLPPGHAEIGKVTARLAELRGRQGRVSEAVVLYQKALRILENAWGPDDPQLLATLEPYSVLLRASHDYVGAGQLDLRSMRIRVIRAKFRSSEHRQD